MGEVDHGQLLAAKDGAHEHVGEVLRLGLLRPRDGRGVEPEKSCFITGTWILIFKREDWDYTRGHCLRV